MTHVVTAKRQAIIAEHLKTGNDPISTLCAILQDEKAPAKVRKDAARTLKDYYHPKLDGMGALIEEFGK